MAERLESETADQIVYVDEGVNRFGVKWRHERVELKPGRDPQVLVVAAWRQVVDAVADGTATDQQRRLLARALAQQGGPSA